ncbi:MAG: DUF4282 domain-containing protein [Asticcacaulis sp.]
MKRIIRQVFGTTRPGDIWGDLLTFEHLVTRPIVHIVYWVGLGLFAIAAFGVLGISIGTAIKEGLPWGFLLALPFFIVGLLGILVGILLWRGFCEFFLAVMNIAEDLRYLRQFQEKLSPTAFDMPQANASPFETPVAAKPADTAEADAPAKDDLADPEKNLLEDPFFRPRFEKREF